ncbi:MAG TPA: hypothetical protein VK181_11010, partial [Rhizobium sp.]|nr:hypothetical protein [Rhizobium sp.]
TMPGVGTNRYAYAGNDPVNGSDPNGHNWGDFLGGFFGQNPVNRQSTEQLGQRAQAAINEKADEVIQFAVNETGVPDIVEGFRERNPKQFLIGVATLASNAPLPGAKGLRGLKAAADASRLLNGPIRITEKGIAHVIERHTVNDIAKFAGKSKFNEAEDLTSLINSGVQQRMVRQANGNFSRTWDVGRPIGFDRVTGQQTSVMTVVTRPSGELITAFPGRP